MSTEAPHCLLADPPWIKAAGGGGRGAQRHYPLMKTTEIARFMRPHVNALSPHAHLWIWVISNAVPDAMYLIDVLGFDYVTDWIWDKGKIATGQYRRARHEMLWLAKRGRIMRQGQWPTSVFTEPPTIHSRKPEESYRCIETISPGPRVELFARTHRVGWSSVGNQLPTLSTPAASDGVPVHP